jgi:hypothetical protein
MRIERHTDPNRFKHHQSLVNTAGWFALVVIVVPLTLALYFGLMDPVSGPAVIVMFCISMILLLFRRDVGLSPFGAEIRRGVWPFVFTSTIASTDIKEFKLHGLYIEGVPSFSLVLVTKEGKQLNVVLASEHQTVELEQTATRLGEMVGATVTKEASYYQQITHASNSRESRIRSAKISLVLAIPFLVCAGIFRFAGLNPNLSVFEPISKMYSLPHGKGTVGLTTEVILWTVGLGMLLFGVIETASAKRPKE